MLANTTQRQSILSKLIDFQLFYQNERTKLLFTALIHASFQKDIDFIYDKWMAIVPSFSQCISYPIMPDIVAKASVSCRSALLDNIFELNIFETLCDKRNSESLLLIFSSLTSTELRKFISWISPRIHSVLLKKESASFLYQLFKHGIILATLIYY